MRFLLLALLSSLAIFASLPARAELVVIANARSGVAVMSRQEVINIFLGRNRQFFNGQEAFPVDLDDAHPARARFYQLLVGKDLSEINAYWSRQVFTGYMQPPPRVRSTEEVLQWVLSRPGGIGFIEHSRADARVRVVYELLR